MLRTQRKGVDKPERDAGKMLDIGPVLAPGTDVANKRGGVRRDLHADSVASTALDTAAYVGEVGQKRTGGCRFPGSSNPATDPTWRTLRCSPLGSGVEDSHEHEDPLVLELIYDSLSDSD
jgi:hypothetical protein